MQPAYERESKGNVYQENYVRLPRLTYECIVRCELDFRSADDSGVLDGFEKKFSDFLTFKSVFLMQKPVVLAPHRWV